MARHCSPVYVKHVSFGRALVKRYNPNNGSYGFLGRIDSKGLDEESPLNTTMHGRSWAEGAVRFMKNTDSMLHAYLKQISDSLDERNAGWTFGAFQQANPNAMLVVLDLAQLHVLAHHLVDRFGINCV